MPPNEQMFCSEVGGQAATLTDFIQGQAVWKIAYTLRDATLPPHLEEFLHWSSVQLSGFILEKSERGSYVSVHIND